MKSKYYLVPVFSLLLLLLFFPACREAAPAPPQQAASQKGDARETWQPAWDKLLAEARKEEKVVIYYGGSLEARTALSGAFKQKYNIDLDFVAGRSPEMPPRIQKERQAGLYLADVAMLGWSPYVTALEPMNVTDPIEPLTVLPEVRDTSKWLRGKLPLLDEKGHALALYMQPSSFHLFNKDSVKKGEVSGVRDLLNPKWKGKIVMVDPTTTGPAIGWYQVVLRNILGAQEGRAYMKELSKNIDVLTRDYRQMVEWVARGKYPIGLATRYDEIAAFIKEGAPIEIIDTDEPRVLMPGWGLLNVIKDRPHPNATQVFVNWLLTPEGLSEIVTSAGYPPTRIDVATKGVGPALLPRPADVFTTKEIALEQLDLISTAKEDFAALLR
ncbi:MAG: extracellular solute-binding protein [Chloroflexi bacterium]|nr:extracellular solute-binding protein [Chloroflexota bacterium]